MFLFYNIPIEKPVCSKYGATKSITSSRSDVIVKDATTISTFWNKIKRLLLILLIL